MDEIARINEIQVLLRVFQKRKRAITYLAVIKYAQLDYSTIIYGRKEKNMNLWGVENADHVD